MPEEDVSDLRDVVDAINKLCDTMKTSHYEEDNEEIVSDTETSSVCEPTVVPQYADSVSEESASVVSYEYETPANVPQYAECFTDLINPTEISVQKVETYSDMVSADEPLFQKVKSSYRHMASPEKIAVQRVEANSTEISVQKVDTYSDVGSAEEIVQKVESYRDIASPEEKAVPRVEANSMEISVQKVESYSGVGSAEEIVQKVESYRDMTSPEEIAVHRVEVYRAERWSDSQISLPGQAEDVQTVTSDTESGIAQFEPISEMYYTASSEVSLLSDLDLPDRAQVDSDSLPEKESKDDRKECVIAGHVAAMRERFESMTRANTPCPDLVRSTSPSLDVFRNVTPSPDQIG